MSTLKSSSKTPPPKHITKALFPVAGLGTRFLPATKATPKEMLVVVDKPLVQYAVEEAYAAGIREMIFVTGRNKRAIEDHFDVAYELESELILHEKNELLALIHAIKPADMDCIFVRQAKSKGLGHAVLCAETLLRNEPFALLLADDLMISPTPILQQMMELFDLKQSSILAVQKVPYKDTNRYGIIQSNDMSADLIQISNVVEKPEPSIAPSNLAVAGRYILTPAIFNFIKSMPRGADDEIQLTDALAAMLEFEEVFAYKYHGVRYDCGTKLGLLQANIDLGLVHAEVGQDLLGWLAKKIESHMQCAKL